jgi:hypothetical protein
MMADNISDKRDQEELLPLLNKMINNLQPIANGIPHLLDDMYHSGDKGRLLQRLAGCLRDQVPIPKWVADDFCDIVMKTYKGEFKSWDEAFGRPHPKNSQPNVQASLLNERCDVYVAVEKERMNGTPIDSALFKKIGKDLAIGGKTKTEGHYYFVKNAFRSKDDIRRMVAAALKSSNEQQIHICKVAIKHVCIMTKINSQKP